MTSMRAISWVSYVHGASDTPLIGETISSCLARQEFSVTALCEQLFPRETPRRRAGRRAWMCGEAGRQHPD
jgi:hypothetical protein